MTLSADPGKLDHIRMDGILLSNDLRKMHIFGRPGRGRGGSRLLKHMAQEALRHGHHFTVLDPRAKIDEGIILRLVSPDLPDQRAAGK